MRDHLTPVRIANIQKTSDWVGGGMAQVVECLLSKCKVELKPSTAKRKKKRSSNNIFQFGSIG
jgi:hypothetical protein